MLDASSLALLEALEQGGQRFSELEAAVRNPKTRSHRLKLLLKLGWAAKDGASYALTERGEEALAHLKSLRALTGPMFSLTNIERIPHREYVPLIEHYCRLLHARFDERLRSIVLFGSVARGQWDRGSDIDLLVVVDAWEGPAWQRIVELQDLKEQLHKLREFAKAVEKGYSAAIQHYALSTEEAKAVHRIYLDMCLDGIILYDKGNFIQSVLADLRQKLGEQQARRIQRPAGGHYWALNAEVA